MWERLGDVVTIEIAKDNWDWGYRPFPQGTKATIVGFGEIAYGRTNNCCLPPGVYENNCWAYVEVDGKRYDDSISTCFLKLPEEVVEARRAEGGHPFDKPRLRDLPETKFWEEDKVRLSAFGLRRHASWEGRYGNVPMRLWGIDYDCIDRKRDDGSPWPFYKVDLPDGGSTGLEERELELVERGNVWRYYHGEPLVFSSLEEEASLMKNMGFYEEVRNSRSGFYSWTLEETLESIEAGDVDGFTAGRGFSFGGESERRIDAVRFHDRDLGRRVAEATLKGFNRGQVR